MLEGAKLMAIVNYFARLKKLCVVYVLWTTTNLAACQKTCVVQTVKANMKRDFTNAQPTSKLLKITYLVQTVYECRYVLSQMSSN